MQICTQPQCAFPNSLFLLPLLLVRTPPSQTRMYKSGV